ncbi:uncharacterized protein LOC109543392 [Dendroctonus ponderosae]|uniref:Attacin C-terminal domain-containing protein n=1 Tax=Dendroctonus ponderosae TaxID=77166 RepID=U4UHJ7_DENPD|nr:uncharacterized protein LOC109543392 [Dendroctonus ponderosae]ERL93464.1 hypothetical protein D910_10755 [Dendroctonus ponderosae]KAH1024798.1 hypothetical protein HUJ05_004232 [Dendroctonus ponderosae]
MQFQLFSGFVLFAALACAFAFPLQAPEDQEEEQFALKPPASRLKREAAEWSGAGGANGKSQGGYAGFVNPNGSKGSVGYGHANGQGHTVSVDGRVPVWSNKNRYGESTLNVGGGATQHFGGPAGNRNLDRRVGVDFNHRF